MRLTQKEKTREPRPACRASLIQHRPKDRLSIVRASFVEICGGNVVAAQLLNEALFITENRISAGESDWFQRKSGYWVSALQGAASERTIRDAFKNINTIGLMEIRHANGDQRGSFYKLNVGPLQTAIDKLEADSSTVEQASPTKSTRVQSTPAESTDQSGKDTAHPDRIADHPGKNDTGSHLSYTRAGEPLLEPCQEPQQTAEQNAAADMAALSDALNKVGRFDCVPGARHKFEQLALETASPGGGGFSLKEQTRMLLSPDFDKGDMRTPTGFLLRVRDLLRQEASQVLDASIGQLKINWCRATVEPGHECRDPLCSEEMHYAAHTTDGKPVKLCAWCARPEAPTSLTELHKCWNELRQEGRSWSEIDAELNGKHQPNEVAA